ncbi:flagellar basal body P-ring formation chaperone FlgA, partial [Salmonella enterica]
MQTFKRGIVVAALLFSPMTLAQDLNSQLTAWFSQRLAGFSDEVVVTVRTPPNLQPSCDQPALSVSGSAKLWGNLNVLARCANEKRYLQVTVQATGNYVVAAA